MSSLAEDYICKSMCCKTHILSLCLQNVQLRTVASQTFLWLSGLHRRKFKEGADKPSCALHTIDNYLFWK